MKKGLRNLLLVLCAVTAVVLPSNPAAAVPFNLRGSLRKRIFRVLGVYEEMSDTWLGLKDDARAYEYLYLCIFPLT